MKGGHDGAVIVAGKPDSSLLIQRVTLPPDHKGFMPAEGKPPLRGGRDCLDQSVDSAGRIAICNHPGRGLHSRR